MSNQTRHDNFVEKIKNKYGDRFTILGQYVLCKDKIEYQCNICNTKYYITANHLLTRGSCRTCSNEKLKNERTKTHEEFVKQANKINPTIEIIGKYINQKTKIEVACKVCGREYAVTPNNFLRGKGCPDCGKITKAKNRTKTHDKYLEELKALGRDDIIVIGKYRGAHKTIECECVAHGHRWSSSTANSILCGRGCPQCAESKGEQSIGMWLRDNNVNFRKEFEFDNLLSDKKNPLRFDFAILDNKDDLCLLVEYDGEFHFKKQYTNDSFEVMQIHDNRKDQYCEDNNIPLLRIPYWDFNNISQILDDKIKDVQLQ